MQKQMNPVTIATLIEAICKHLSITREAFLAKIPVNFQAVVTASNPTWDDFVAFVNCVDAAFSTPTLLNELARKQSEISEINSALAKKENDFKNLIENFTDGILIHHYGKILYVNSKIIEYLHYQSSSDLIGHSIYEKLIPPEKVHIIKEHVAILMDRGGTNSAIELEILMNHATDRFRAECSTVPITFNGEKCIAIIYRDLTDRKKLQAHVMTSDRLIALGQLAAGVSHEINNPLCYVMMNLELLSDSLKVNKLPTYDKQIATILKGLERIKTVVRDLKTVSRGTEEERPTRVDVNAVLDSVLSMAKSEIQHRAIMSFSPTIVEPVWIDENRLAQVLLNIVINAAQSIPLGAVDLNRVQIRTYMDDQKNCVVTEIKDTGSGMSDEVQKRIFEPFYTTKPIGSGTGLGLTICQNIVNQFKGTIEFESTENCGTTFRISFPSSVKEAINETEKIDDQPILQQEAQVLLIDDDQELLNVLQEIISVNNTCIGFTNARNALTVLKDNDAFDCVICDLMMPNMGGVQFYQTLKEIAPHYLSRVIFLTGGSFTKETAEFLQSPDITYCEKPVDMRALLRIIRDKASAKKPASLASVIEGKKGSLM